jgi:hypothetical protein
MPGRAWSVSREQTAPGRKGIRWHTTRFGLRFGVTGILRRATSKKLSRTSNQALSLSKDYQKPLFEDRVWPPACLPTLHHLALDSVNLG